MEQDFQADQHVFLTTVAGLVRGDTGNPNPDPGMRHNPLTLPDFAVLISIPTE